MKFSVVLALLLISAQAHGVAFKGNAKNARRHEQLEKRQASPPVVSPPPATPTTPPPPPPPTTTPPSPSSTPVSTSPTSPASNSSPPSSPSQPSPTSDTYNPTPDTSSTNSDSYSSPSNSPISLSSSSATVATIASTYVITVNGSALTTKRTTVVSTEATGTEKTGSSNAASTGTSSPSSSSGPETSVLVGGVVAGIIVLFGLIAVVIRLFKRNKRLDRRTKALASEVERGLSKDAPRPSNGHGPAGPSMTQHPFVPSTEDDENQYRPAEYDPERYYQNVQAQQQGDFYPQPSSPPQNPQQLYQSRPFSSTPVAYTQDVVPPPQYQGQTNYAVAPLPYGKEGDYEPRTESDITHANAPSRPSSVPPVVAADPKLHKPDEMSNNSVGTAMKPDVIDV